VSFDLEKRLPLGTRPAAEPDQPRLPPGAGIILATVVMATGLALAAWAPRLGAVLAAAAIVAAARAIWWTP